MVKMLAWELGLRRRWRNPEGPKVLSVCLCPCEIGKACFCWLSCLRSLQAGGVRGSYTVPW